ncbi:hypothetical protein niasHT_017502 [Heterodera trifolii]|uniref:Uncharacterized protein n=1 Tax=Heterodera trifolii TaxID=157864 RepID=A0ABD2L627_9BILA
MTNKKTPKKAPSDAGNKVPPIEKGNGYYRPPSDNTKKNAQLKRNIETKMGTTDSEEKKTEPMKKFYKMFSWVQQMFSWVQKENVETKIDDDETLLKRLDNVFMVKHPPELLNFWRHAVKLNPENPLDAFSELDSLTLVGPFLLLAAAHSERHTKNTKNGATATADEDAQQQHHLLLDSRFATDLPEMETLLVHRGGRFCYWRDVPEEMPNILVHVTAGGVGGEGHDHQPQQHFPTTSICGKHDLFAALQFMLNKLASTGTTTAKEKKQQSNNTGTTTTSNTGVKPDQKLAHLFPDNFDMMANNGADGPDCLQMLKKRRDRESLVMLFHGIVNKFPPDDKDIGYRQLLLDDAKKNAQLKRNIKTKMCTTDNEEKKAEPRKKFCKMFSLPQLSFCSVFLLLSFAVFCCASNETFNDKQMPSNNSTRVTPKPPFFLPTDPFWRPVFDAMIYASIAITAITVFFGVPFMIFIACVACRSSRNAQRFDDLLEQRAQQRREAERIERTAALRDVLEMPYSRKY